MNSTPVSRGQARELLRSICLVLAVLVGCGRNDHPASTAGFPRLVEERPANWSAEWGRGYFVAYETVRNLKDPSALRVEAESIWATVMPVVEARGACVVQLRASNPTAEVELPGNQLALTARRNWDFVLFREQNGHWIWLDNVEPPKHPCFPKQALPR